MARDAGGSLVGARPLDRSAVDTDRLDLSSPQFARHLGSLLAATRHRDKRSVYDVAAATGGDFDPGWLRRIERGSVPLDDSVIEAVSRAYGADLGAILPTRMPVMIEERVMSAGGLRVLLERGDPTFVLSSYLRLIRSMREQHKTPVIALRRDDIERLAEYLHLDGAQVVERLASLMGATAAQRIALGSLFAAGAIVIGLLVAAGHADAGRVTTFVPRATGSITATTSGTIPVAIDAAADAARLMPAVRLHPPAPAPVVAPVAPGPVTPAAPIAANRSGCNTDPQGAVMSLTIPDISYQCPVYAGGQSQLDAGFVTLVTDAGPTAVLATSPGAAGTLWLAGHRTSHGGAFAQVPDLAVGALIVVSDGTVTATYRVVGRAYIEVRNGSAVDASGHATADATLKAVIRPDMGGNLAPRLLLQTCNGAQDRWMIYADLVTG